jgi:ATP-dependent helicase HrpB
VVVAPPGAGKTTRVPPALCADGPLILLQPRRVAARAIARRIASEQGLTLGQEVGWQVRFERRFTPDTRLLVATEGILSARLAADPLLSGFRTVVLDEFHERSLHADLALAFARQAARARGDLRVVVMSATLDAARVAAFLDGCPVIEVPGRPHPVAVEYRPELGPAAAVRELVRHPGGHLLVFLPGAPEIRAAAAELADLARRADLSLLPLHGGLGAEEQDAALRPSARRKILLATNLAETSLTVDGVTDVVDTGLQKVARYDPARGIDRLETERISLDSAEQRAGRAGRTGPGRAWRLWDPRLALAPHREPEIRRADLAAAVLEVIAWGGDPLRFEWFEEPPRERLTAALELLGSLGAIRDGKLTPGGERMRRLPLHPRLARVLLACGGSARAAAACAVLSEDVRPGPGGTSSASDVLSLLDRLPYLPERVTQAARALERLAAAAGEGGAEVADDEAGLRRALLLGFPDRVAQRRAPRSPRLLLASGHGAVLARESGVGDGDFVLALDVAAGPRGAGSEALVRLASRVEREWLSATARDTVHRFEPGSGSVRAVERDLLGELVLAERPVPPDPQAASRLLIEEIRRRGLGPEGESLARRLRFAAIDLDLDQLVEAACAGRTTLPPLDAEGLLPADVLRQLARLAPSRLPVPSGREAALEYQADGTVTAAVKLQELFGLAETPRLGPRQEPVLLQLLAPNGRPVQATRDLRSFWERTYPAVRKELRGRYPKHPWPEDPWTAPPTARTTRRGAGR